MYADRWKNEIIILQFPSKDWKFIREKEPQTLFSTVNLDVIVAEWAMAVMLEI